MCVGGGVGGELGATAARVGCWWAAGSGGSHAEAGAHMGASELMRAIRLEFSAEVQWALKGGGVAIPWCSA